MVADGKVQHCFHWFWEAYATLEGWSDFFKLGVLFYFLFIFYIPEVLETRFADWGSNLGYHAKP
jgi:hypothetical protein